MASASCLNALFLLLLTISTTRARQPLISKVEGWVTRNGAHFELNGSPFLFNGFNSYWLMHIASEPNDRHKVTEVLRDASAAGLSVCRTLAFSDGKHYNGLQISPGVYDERVFKVNYFLYFLTCLTLWFLLSI